MAMVVVTIVIVMMTTKMNERKEKQNEVEHRAIRNDFRGFNNLSYTIHLR